MAPKDLARIEIRTRAELRQWLAEHHTQADSVWCITYKKSHPNFLPFGEVVEELLCWGWIDSSVRRLDEARMMHLISPRKESSAWSAVNKEIVERMRAAGQMTPAGEAKIAAARANGMWDWLNDVERMECPPDLLAALDKDLIAGWEAYPQSVKCGALEWLKLAKTEATRQKRIDDITSSLRQGLRPSNFRC